MIKSMIKRVLARSGYTVSDAAWVTLLERSRAPFMPPGHFYSPYPDLKEIATDEHRVFDKNKTVLDIDLRPEYQLSILKQIAQIYSDIHFPESPAPGFRYHYENSAYSYSDGIVLHAMLRLIKPKRLIEIGSGYSSAMTLDTNERWLDNGIELTFIEPYPQLLHGLMTAEDRRRHQVIESRLQDVDRSVFAALGEGDVLFVDSTHVSKVDSDVNTLFFEILPRLHPGVYIHFHDVFYPFEYPREWIYEGRAWQELYLLRAFLQCNADYVIEYFQDFMFQRHREMFEQLMPLCTRNGGGNIWIRKLR